LLGESYGGFRALKVARAVQENQGFVISGILMVSPLIDGSMVFGGSHLALKAALQLPSMAAAELERRHAFTPEALADAEHFALTDYLTTLAGPAPEGDKARAFYGKVAQLTGLSVDVVEKTRGFVRGAYIKRVREAQGEVVSNYDANFAVPDPFPDSLSETGSDPILDGITRAYGGAFVGYARDELGFKTEMTYELLSHEVTSKWNWGGHRSAPDASGDLRELLALSPSFKLLVAGGYTDLVVPYAVNRYTLDHIPPIGAPGRTALKLYRGGHMFYTNDASRAAFTTDAKAFYGAPSQ
jgi:carboxypeptidase C (cathepsin A)